MIGLQTFLIYLAISSHVNSPYKPTVNKLLNNVDGDKKKLPKYKKILDCTPFTPIPSETQDGEGVRGNVATI